MVLVLAPAAFLLLSPLAPLVTGPTHVSALACCCAQTGNAVEFVKLLLDMRDKYETTIAQAFSDDKNFKNTLNSVSGEAAACRSAARTSLSHVCRSPVGGIPSVCQSQQPGRGHGGSCNPADERRCAIHAATCCSSCCLCLCLCPPLPVQHTQQSFEEFVNKQPRSPEFVSLYIDELLRNKKQEISDADVELRMDKVMPLFRCAPRG